MNFKNDKKIIFIILFFLMSISFVQIVLLPSSRNIIKFLLIQPIPEKKINVYLRRICKKDIFVNSGPDTTISLICNLVK